MIDTHCHIDEEAYAADREEVLARQQESGVEAMIVPGVNAASVTTVLEVCHAHPGYCFPALGLHPEDVKAGWEEQLAVVEEAIRAHRNELVAIGEIGLDYYWDKTYKEEQKEVLRRQLLLARVLNLPVILHNREATEDMLNIVKEITNYELRITNYELRITNYESRITNYESRITNYGLRGVFHCFNGSRETAEQILGMGFYIGIGGVLTFKNCKLGDTLSQLNKQRVLEQIVLETDAPYMAPVPHRGERNESRFMRHVAERLAEVFATTPEDIIALTTRNARTLFGI
ncbi:MAG: TatD family hydrolase [Paludibacteraceae bacterium]|nr:TatD family hydrolase [Paludibacteraceae bacterium]